MPEDDALQVFGRSACVSHAPYSPATLASVHFAFNLLFGITHMTGTVKKLVSDKGFGFIREDRTGTEYFFHRSALDRCSFDLLRVGQTVTFNTEDSPRGLRACSICVE